jgi:alkylation response protein AidB-like acyl-CoA dehydrogenase
MVTAPTTPERLRELTDAVAATAERYDRSAEFPWDGIRAVHESGALVATVGRQYGGLQISAVDRARLLQALGEGDPSVALIVANTLAAHARQTESGDWPEDLYRRVLGESAQRPVLINTVRAEPELGAPARGGLPATTARRSGDGWVLAGRKSYATASEGLAYHLVWAKTDDEIPRVGHFIVPGDSQGIEIVATWDHLGLRSSSTHDVIYDAVELPGDHFIDSAYQGTYRDRAGTGGVAALAGAAIYLGVARAAQRFFLSFANTRVPTALGAPIATTPHIRSVAGRIEAELIAAEELLYGLTARAERGDADAVGRTPIAKVIITRAAVQAVELAVASLGNPGLSRHNPLERHLRDVLCSRVHPPQEDTALLALGTAVLDAAGRA